MSAYSEGNKAEAGRSRHTGPWAGMLREIDRRLAQRKGLEGPWGLIGPDSYGQFKLHNYVSGEERGPFATRAEATALCKKLNAGKD